MLCFTANAIKKERIAYITVHPFWCRDAREACLVDKGRTWHSTVGGLQFTYEMAALWVSTDRGALLRSGTQLHWGFLTPDPLQKQVVVMPSPAAPCTWQGFEGNIGSAVPPCPRMLYANYWHLCTRLPLVVIMAQVYGLICCFMLWDHCPCSSTSFNKPS